MTPGRLCPLKPLEKPKSFECIEQATYIFEKALKLKGLGELTAPTVEPRRILANFKPKRKTYEQALSMCRGKPVSKRTFLISCFFKNIVLTFQKEILETRISLEVLKSVISKHCMLRYGHLITSETFLCYVNYRHIQGKDFVAVEGPRKEVNAHFEEDFHIYSLLSRNDALEGTRPHCADGVHLPRRKWRY